MLNLRKRGALNNEITGKLFKTACVILLLQGGIVAMYLFTISNVQAGDFQAFYFAAQRVVTGEAFVGRPPPTGANTAWVFPPIIVLYFVPLTVVSLPAAFVVQNLFNLGYLGGTAYTLIKKKPITLDHTDCWLLYAAILFNPLAVSNFFQGQMNALVLLFIVVGISRIASGQSIEGGVALGAAALVKLWPSALGVWLLWRREWRAIIGATAVGIGGLSLSALLFGFNTVVRWFEVVVHRGRLHRLAQGISPDNTMTSIARLFSGLFPGVSPLIYFTVTFFIVGTGVVVIISNSTPREQPIAISAVIISGALLTLPAGTFPYLIVPLSLGIATLYQTTSSQISIILFIGIILCGIPANLQNFQTLAGVFDTEITISVLEIFLRVLPPYLLGLILVTIGQSMQAIND